jgi:alcohol dehydrogenase class IV
VLGIPHGRACGIMLPHGIRQTAPAAASRWAQIARSLGMRGGNDLEETQMFIDACLDLYRRIGMPSTIKGCGVEEERFFGELDAMVQNAMFVCVDSTPGEVKPDDLERMYRDAWDGAPVRVI